MSCDWPTKTLDDVCEKITDGAHASPKSVINGKSMASVKDLTPFGVDLSSARQIDVEDFNKLVKQGCRPEVGDVLIAKDGNSALDTVCTVRNPLDAVLLSSVAILRPDTEQLDSDFLKYYFSSKYVIEYLKSNFISGAAIPRVVLRDFRKAEIKLPPLDVQKKIAYVLNSLNDKIELNHQINQTLETMAQAIFKSWFIDFEPVKAKIAAIEAGEDAEGVTRAAMSVISGKTDEELDQLQAEQPEHYTQLKTVAELFPSAMQDSELGEIPLGWMVRTLGSLLTELRRGISPKYADEGGILVINQKCIRNHSVNFSLARRNDTKLQKVEGRKIQVGNVLVNSTGVGTLGRLATIRYLPEPAVVDSHITVVRASDEISPLFLNEYMLTKESFIEASGAGSTGQTELRKQVLEELLVVVPNRILIDSFETTIKPISLSIAKSEQECQLLTQLRDTLLPKLLSGELEINTTRTES